MNWFAFCLTLGVFAFIGVFVDRTIVGKTFFFPAAALLCALAAGLRK